MASRSPLGSGFFVRDGEIASNLHVVGRRGKRLTRSGSGRKRSTTSTVLVAVDVERDLVLLKISGARASTLALWQQ